MEICNNIRFEIVNINAFPVIDSSHPDAKEIQGGFEGGLIVKIEGIYHMFPTERRGTLGVGPEYDRVKTTIGHWTSQNAINWKRDSTILEATGIYAVSEEDIPENDRRSAIWAAMPIFNEDENRWNLFYVAYTTHTAAKLQVVSIQ